MSTPSASVILGYLERLEEYQHRIRDRFDHAMFAPDGCGDMTCRWCAGPKERLATEEDEDVCETCGQPWPKD